MTKQTLINLNADQEQLLQRFFDGECSLLEKQSVRKLIEQNESATDFLSELGQGSRMFRDYFKSPAAASDMWQRVLGRIEQEERAAVFLGKRTESSSSFEWRSMFAGLRGLSLSGVAVAAALVLFILPNTQKSNLQPTNGFKQGLDYLSASEELGGAQLQAVNVGPMSVSPRVRQVSSDQYLSSIDSIPRLIEDRAPSSVEVDWVRSHGRVNLIQDSEDRAPIIWIKKRVPVRGSNPNATVGQANHQLSGWNR